MLKRRFAWILATAAGVACGPTVTSSSGGTTTGGTTTGGGPESWACAPGPSDLGGSGGASTCHAGQVCASSYTEGGSPTTYGCSDMPAACAANPTCDCLVTNVCAGNQSPDPNSPCGCDATGCYAPCVIP